MGIAGRAANLLLTFSYLLAFLAIITPNLKFWDQTGAFIYTGGRIPLLLSVVCLLISALLYIIDKKRPDYNYLIIGPVFIFFTDWFVNLFALVQSPSGKGLIILLTIVFFLCYWLKVEINWSLILLLSLTVILYNFFDQANGYQLSSDDHPTFMHRLMLLKDNFPNIPIYDPHWNGGYDQRYFFATGAINFYLLTYFITKFFPVEIVYNYCVIFVTFILPIISNYSAAKLLGFSTRTAWIACILIIAPCFEWYRWILGFGPMGFATTCALLPLVFALVIRFLDQERKFNILLSLLLVASFSLMLCWSLSGLVFIPIIFLTIYKLFTEKFYRYNHFKLTSSLVLLINIPWIILFLTVSKVGRFLNINQSSSKEVTASIIKKPLFADSKTGFNWEVCLDIIREHTSNANFLLIFFSIPAIIFLPKKIRIIFSLTIGWLLILGLVISQFKPQLELDRMLLIALLLMAIPVANLLDCLIAKLLKLPTQFNWQKALQTLQLALLSAFIVVGPLAVNSIIRQHTALHYRFQDEFTDNLIKTLAGYQNKGRALFTGMILHEIDGGHLAPIPQLSGTSIVAQSFVHNLWQYTQVFPPEIIENPELIPTYLATYNVAVVFAHEPVWLDYLYKHPELFEKKGGVGKFRYFEVRNFQSEYFYEGAGKLISFNNNSVKLKLNTPNAVIKFRHFDFLTTNANSDCTISAKQIFSDTRLIQLSNCPINQEITISSKLPWERII